MMTFILSILMPIFMKANKYYSYEDNNENIFNSIWNKDPYFEGKLVIFIKIICN